MDAGREARFSGPVHVLPPRLGRRPLPSFQTHTFVHRCRKPVVFFPIVFPFCPVSCIRFDFWGTESRSGRAGGPRRRRKPARAVEQRPSGGSGRAAPASRADLHVPQPAPPTASGRGESRAPAPSLPPPRSPGRPCRVCPSLLTPVRRPVPVPVSAPSPTAPSRAPPACQPSPIGRRLPSGGLLSSAAFWTPESPWLPRGHRAAPGTPKGGAPRTGSSACLPLRDARCAETPGEVGRNGGAAR